jgi:hypothetical protein
VKFLVDAQLPARLVRALTEEGDHLRPDQIGVAERGGMPEAGELDVLSAWDRLRDLACPGDEGVGVELATPSARMSQDSCKILSTSFCRP